MNYTYKTKPYTHQRDVFERTRELEAYALLMEQGCVDGETEYLSPTGWRRMDEYDGGGVAQFEPDTWAVSFVKPTGYLEVPCDEMLRFETHCLQMCLSPGHRILFTKRGDDEPMEEQSALQVADSIKNGKPHLRIPGTCSQLTTWQQSSLTDAQLRVQIMVNADGSYPQTVKSRPAFVLVNLKKQRKKDRLRHLLAAANIQYKEYKSAPGYTRFAFDAPLTTKSYAPLWQCSGDQLRVVAEELLHWDGSRGPGNRAGRITSFVEADADFFQYAFMAAGYRTRKTTVEREMLGRVVRYWEVVLSHRTSFCLTRAQIQSVTPRGRMMYCFEVPTGALIMRRAGVVFATGNTGKTKVIVDTVAYLYGQRKLEAVLVIAPNGVHRNWGLNEIPIHMPDRVPRQVVVWDAAKTTKQHRKALDALFNGAEELKVLLMNVEAFSTSKGVDFAKRYLAAFGRVMVVVDESSKIKNVRAQRTKNIVRLREAATYRRILTGTPVTQNHLDVFPQFYFLDPKILGQQSFHVFKHYYSIVVKKKAWKVNSKGQRVQYQYEDVLRARNMGELNRRIGPWSYRVTKAECLDLPPKIYTEIPVEMTVDQRRLYKRLKTDLLLEAGGEEIPVLMQLTRLLRLHQIAGGHVVTEDGTCEPIPGTNPKLAALLDDVEDLPVGEQCIIWARFRAEIQAIAAALDAAYGAGSVGMYYGDTSGQERTEIIQRFQAGDLRFFVGSQQAAGMGLTLTAASTVYYYSNSFSLEDRLQSEDRAHRIGQHKPVLYKDIVALGTIDRLVIKALKAKKNLADLITGDGERGGRMTMTDVLKRAEWADSIRERGGLTDGG